MCDISLTNTVKHIGCFSEPGSDGLDSDSPSDSIKPLSGKGQKRKEGRKRKNRNSHRRYGMGAGVTMGWAKLRHKRRHQGKTKSKRTLSSSLLPPGVISASSQAKVQASANMEKLSEMRDAERERKRRRKSLTLENSTPKWSNDDYGCMSCCLPRIVCDEKFAVFRTLMQC